MIQAQCIPFTTSSPTKHHAPQYSLYEFDGTDSFFSGASRNNSLRERLAHRLKARHRRDPFSASFK